MKKVAFIGTGNMGGAIVRAVCRVQKAGSICISNHTRARSEALAEECGCAVAENNTLCAQDADIVVLGVKPYLVREVLREIAPALKSRQLIVSMAAGVSGEAISELVPQNPVVRILPNTPCAVGKGLMLIVPCKNASEEDLRTAAELLAPCGRCVITDEAHAEAGMVIGGCTPAFTAQFIEALADGGVAVGLPRADALEWAAQAVAGSAELLLASGKHPGQIKDQVCSPGGTTIQGVKALEQRAFRAAVIEAVEAAYGKSVQLGK